MFINEYAGLRGFAIAGVRPWHYDLAHVETVGLDEKAGRAGQLPDMRKAAQLGFKGPENSGAIGVQGILPALSSQAKAESQEGARIQCVPQKPETRAATT